MTDATVPARIDAPAMDGLTAEEAQFVYLTEVQGLPVKVAVAQSGMPAYRASLPHIQQAREILKREVRGALNITKEDVVFGIREAIHHARLVNEPGSEIAGWKEIARLLGYDAPQKVDINIKQSIAVLREHVQHMDDAQLAELVGANDIIDGDFYRIEGRTDG